jgi:hypothetical protein
MTYMTPREAAVRDSIRATIADCWALYLARPRGKAWTIEGERQEMWELLNAGYPYAISLEEFTRIDETCHGHVDWYSKLTLRVADELTGWG